MRFIMGLAVPSLAAAVAITAVGFDGSGITLGPARALAMGGDGGGDHGSGGGGGDRGGGDRGSDHDRTGDRDRSNATKGSQPTEGTVSPKPPAPRS